MVTDLAMSNTSPKEANSSDQESGSIHEQISISAVAPSSSTPDGGYGWVCTTCVAFVNGHSWGINSSYGVFLAYYLDNDTFEGSSHLQYAFIGSLSIGATLITSPLATICARELGTRFTMLLGTLMQSLGLIFASLSTAYWQLLLSQGALFGLGMGFVFVPSYGIIAQWFTRRRALANGIAISGAGLGGLVYSLASGAGIQHVGLNWTFRILSIVTFVVNVVCIMFIKDRHKEIGARQLAFDLTLFRRIEYLLVLAFSFFSILGYFVLIFTLADYATKVGLNASQGSVVSALFSLGQAMGRPLIGYFSDKVGHINMTMFTTMALATFSLVLWINAKVYGMLILFTILEGLVAGSFWVCISPVIAEVLGLSNLPSGLSLMWLTMTLPAVCSEPIALQIVSSTGNYLGTQLFTGFSFLAAALMLGFLRSWKITESEIDDGDSSEASPGRLGYRKSLLTNFFNIRKV